MNEPSELWNLPWQELQRSLAAGFGDSAGGNPTVNSPTALKSAGARSAASWLVRARSRAKPLYQSVAK
jgi:hypothetical protein